MSENSDSIYAALPARRRMTDTETPRRVRPTDPAGIRRYDTVAQIN